MMFSDDKNGCGNDLSRGDSVSDSLEGGVGPLMQRNIDRIRELVEDEGISDIDVLSERMRLAVRTIQSYASLGGVSLRNVSRKRNVEKILKLVEEEEIYDVDILNERTGLAVSTIRSYASFGGISLKRNPRKKRIEILRNSLAKGENSLELLCNQVRLKPSGIMELCREEGIGLPEDLIPYGTNYAMDDIIEEGLTLQEMGDRANLSRQRVEQYLHESGQHGIWKKSRGNKEKLVSLLKLRILQLSEDEGFATRKAAEYVAKSMRCSYDFEDLTEMFNRYDNVRKGGERLSLARLSEGRGICSATTAKNILDRVDLEPMYGKRSK
ncbi:hypothetical protein K8R33_01105 [archaeon]|nr:hypothetical protein [archaeon]